jgi:hypothetical protein
MTNDSKNEADKLTTSREITARDITMKDELSDKELDAVAGGMLYLDYRPQYTICGNFKTGTSTTILNGGVMPLDCHR